MAAWPAASSRVTRALIATATVFAPVCIFMVIPNRCRDATGSSPASRFVKGASSGAIAGASDCHRRAGAQHDYVERDRARSVDTHDRSMCRPRHDAADRP